MFRTEELNFFLLYRGFNFTDEIILEEALPNEI